MTKMTAAQIVYPFRTAADPMTKPCPAVARGWCQAPWTCAQPCTGRDGNSLAAQIEGADDE